MRTNCRGFTLIELLVVITIIVVLLALLTPALDKAIMQAELASCGAQLRGHHTAASNYAVGNKRRYPDRDKPTGQTAYWMNSIAWPPVQWDLRLLMMEYLSPKSHNDPASPEVDFSVEAPQSGDPTLPLQDNNTFVYSNYSLFYGWTYTVPGASGMKRLGQGWAIDATDRLQAKNVRQRFSVLAGDFDYDTGLAGGATGDQVLLMSHPDTSGKAWEQVLQDTSSPLSAAIQGRADGDFTFSRWVIQEPGIPTRGTLEQNFVFSDGGVDRYPAVDQMDPRMLYVPLDQTGGFFIQVPRR